MFHCLCNHCQRGKKEVDKLDVYLNWILWFFLSADLGTSLFCLKILLGGTCKSQSLLLSLVAWLAYECKQTRDSYRLLGWDYYAILIHTVLAVCVLLFGQISTCALNSLWTWEKSNFSGQRKDHGLDLPDFACNLSCIKKNLLRISFHQCYSEKIIYSNCAICVRVFF